MDGLLATRFIGIGRAKTFVIANHYAKSMPAINKLAVGLFDGQRLVGVSTWGYGTRPEHTIKALFPSLGTADYLELGRLCLLDELPRNSESQFMAESTRLIRENNPDLQLLFSWADGLRGKPGYVYQACSWLYGGFIWTDAYVDTNGELVHPRLYQNKTRIGEGLKQGKRPESDKLSEMGWKHYYGKQFRYVKFLCGHKDRKRLLAESPMRWTTEYPKHRELEWKVWAGEGSRVNCEQPVFESAVRFRNPAPLFD